MYPRQTSTGRLLCLVGSKDVMHRPFQAEICCAAVLTLLLGQPLQNQLSLALQALIAFVQSAASSHQEARISLRAFCSVISPE